MRRSSGVPDASWRGPAARAYRSRDPWRISPSTVRKRALSSVLPTVTRIAVGSPKPAGGDSLLFTVVPREAARSPRERSAHSYGGRYHVQAGAGIVADSNAESEDRECGAKAGAVLEALHATEAEALR